MWDGELLPDANVEYVIERSHMGDAVSGVVWQSYTLEAGADLEGAAQGEGRPASP